MSTPGELGTVANLELHSRIGMNMLGRHDAALEQALGGKLPADTPCRVPTPAGRD